MTVKARPTVTCGDCDAREISPHRMFCSPCRMVRINHLLDLWNEVNALPVRDRKKAYKKIESRLAVVSANTRLLKSKVPAPV